MPNGRVAERLHLRRGTAARMSTSRAVTPRCRIRARAFAARPAGGAEAGHRQRLDLSPRHAERVERLARDEQRQRRVEPAGDADRRPAACRCASSRFASAGDLGVEDLLAALVAASPGPAARTGAASTRRISAGVRPAPGRASNGTRRNSRPRRGRGGCRRSCSSCTRSRRSRSRSTSATSQVLVAAEPLRLGEHGAVLGDRGSARRRRRRSSIRRRRTRRRRSRRCSGPTGRRRAAGGSAALPIDLVAGRQVDQHRRPGERLRASSAAPAPTGPRRSRRRRRSPSTSPHSKSRSVPNGTRLPGDA